MRSKLLKLLLKNNEMSASQLADELGVSRQMIHRILNKLQEEELVQKLGKSPKTYYRLRHREVKTETEIVIPDEKITFLENNFLFVSENGELYNGVEAMSAWCHRHKLPLVKTIDEFITTRKKYLAYKDQNGLISGLDKIKNTKGFDFIGLDELYYQDFYAIERFGKTRFGNLLHFAKQGQNKSLMKKISDDIRPGLLQLIQEASIDAVGYIPPTIRREIQIMQVLQKNLNLPLPHIQLIKVNGEIVVPQKALSKLEDRISNARSSIVVGETRPFKTILLIDDAVGSGATINETALKLKSKGIAIRVIGYAVIGSFKGFDVLQEV